MSDSFPPISKRRREIESVIAFWQGLISNRSAIYVSAPITSGQRYLRWIEQHPKNIEFSGSNQNSDFVANVIEKNRAHAKSVINQLRNSFPCDFLIDPTAVPDLKEWTQDDYRYAWGCIIEQFAKIVVCSNDWQFSSGCSYEFLIAKRAQIKTIDENHREITLEKGRQLIIDAVLLLSSHGLTTTFHVAVHEELGKL